LKHFTISEVTADWQELMTLQCIMWPSVVRVIEQSDPWCTWLTFHRSNQPHKAFTLYPVNYLGMKYLLSESHSFIC